MRPLNPRQKEVVRYVMLGLSNGQIAIQMNTQTEAVKHCLTRIFKKLGVKSRIELVNKEKLIASE